MLFQVSSGCRHFRIELEGKISDFKVNGACQFSHRPLQPSLSHIAPGAYNIGDNIHLYLFFHFHCFLLETHIRVKRVLNLPLTW